MAQLKHDYYSLKLYFCRLNPKHFFQQLDNALTNNAPISSLEISKFPKYKKDHKEYENDFELENIKFAHAAFERIKDYLTHNKASLDLERRKSVFRVWFHWLLGSNMNYWEDYKECSEINDPFRINLDVFSLTHLYEFASSVLYELDNILCCFDYTEFIQTSSSVYHDMLIQPDNLSRAICSQSIDNVRFLVDKVGLDINNISYRHPTLNNPLEWAYYCDNLDIFNYLIKNGCSLNHRAVFYSQSCLKNFKFALSLYFIKENSNVYDLLEFDRMEFMSFQFYEQFSENQIIEIYKSLFEIGFSLGEQSEILNLNDMFSFNPSRIDESRYSQLLPCICQNGIKPNIIKYLIDKYSEIIIASGVQRELTRIVKQSTLFYQYSLFPRAKPKLKPKDLMNILKTVLPLLNESSIKALKRSGLSNKFVGCHLKSYSHPAIYKLIDDNHSNYLFERVDFKLLDILISYGLLNHDHYSMILNYLSTSYVRQSFKEQLKLFSGFLCFFLENEIFDKNMTKHWLKNRLSDMELMDIEVENVNHLTKAVLSFCKSDISTPKSLLKLSRFAVRKYLKSFSNESLKSLNLPSELETFVLNSIIPNKLDFVLE